MIYNNKIIVTGAGGLIGCAICQLLYKKGLNFTAVYKSRPPVKPEWDFMVSDLSKEESIQASLWCGVDLIIHTAASIPSKELSPNDCFSINKKIDHNISQIIQINNIRRLIFLSSTSIYGITTELKSEDSSVSPLNIYSEGKLNSENLFLEINNCETVVLRINAPYYYQQKHDTVLSIFIKNALNNQDLLYHGTGARCQDFTHVIDIAEFIFILINKREVSASQIYNISGGNPISMKELAELVVSLVPNCKSKVESSGIPDPEENHQATFSIRKVFDHFHWKPKYTIELGIREWIEKSAL